MLGPDEQARFDQWRRSQSEMATFFLDSIDELKITQKSFEQALKSLGRACAGNMDQLGYFRRSPMRTGSRIVSS
jgi:hypothetical protein